MNHLKLFESFITSPILMDEEIAEIKSIFLDIKDEFDIEEHDMHDDPINDVGLYYKFHKVGKIIYISIYCNEPGSTALSTINMDNSSSMLSKYINKVVPALKNFASRLEAMGYEVFYYIDENDILDEFTYNGYFTIEISSKS